jgi:flagellar hook-associated protein 2
MNSDMVSILDLAATSVVATEPEEGRRFAPVGRFFAANEPCYGAPAGKFSGNLQKFAHSTSGGFVPIAPLWKPLIRIMATSTNAINVSGLTSSTYGSFDWQTMVDKLVQADSIPVTSLQTQETTNQSKISALTTIQTDLTQLQTYAQALNDPTLFTSRTTAVSDANWQSTAANGTAAGSYTIAITRLATAASRVSGGNIASALSSTSDVAGLTLATLPTATAVTAGNFTVNGQTVAIALTDSLQDAFTKIFTATGGTVTASYNPATDGIKLTNTDTNDSTEIVLGAVNDSSNFLHVMQLANNGTKTVTSANSLGAVALNVPLAQANLGTAITAVDGSANGSFTINGVSLSYNLNTDSLATVLARINASTAGVTASYDSAANHVVLTNNSTGDIGLGANDAATLGQVGLLGALDLTGAPTLQHGQNTLFSVNGGPAIASASNTIDGTILGIPGLTVTATTATTQTVTVATDTASIETAIQNFAGQYNTVQSYISQQTSITTGTDGKVTAALLSNDQDIQNWASGLRSQIFATVPGLSGTVKQLANLGLDFDSSGQLIIKDSAKLGDALANHGADVAAYFTQASTGIADSINTYLDNLLLPSGGLAMDSNSLLAANKSIDTQIATLQTRLDQERTSLTAAFEAMQTAQTTAQSQIAYLNAMTNLSKGS